VTKKEHPALSIVHYVLRGYYSYSKFLLKLSELAHLCPSAQMSESVVLLIA
jgi:hypothetical protein